MNEERLKEARKSLCGWSGCDDCQMLREAIAEIEYLWDQRTKASEVGTRLGGCLLSCLFLGFCWGIGIAGGVLAYRIMT